MRRAVGLADGRMEKGTGVLEVPRPVFPASAESVF
jgi:hypothetical protein